MRGLASLALVVAACTSCGQPQATSEGSANQEATAVDASLSVAALLEILKVPHVEIARSLGPHTFEYRAVTTLGADKNVEEVVDEVTLRYQDTPAGTELDLSQSNSLGRGRHVIVTEEKMYTRVLPHPFVAMPVESEIHETFADDLWRAPLDVLTLAAPVLAMSPGAVTDGARRFDLAMGAADEQLRAPATSWRSDARVTSIEGFVLLDVAHRIPREFDLQVRYRLQTSSGDLQGLVHLRGSTRLAGSPLVIDPPDSGQIGPETVDRGRLEPVRRRLLDGLAAP